MYFYIDFLFFEKKITITFLKLQISLALLDKKIQIQYIPNWKKIQKIIEHFIIEYGISDRLASKNLVAVDICLKSRLIHQ